MHFRLIEILILNYWHMTAIKWMLKEVDREKESQRLIDLGLLKSETMNVTGIYKLISEGAGSIDPKTELVVLKGVKVKCGICRHEKPFSLEENEVRLLLKENLKSNVYDFECPECNSKKQLQMHTTDTVGIGEEYWITVETTSEAVEYKDNPDLGWSFITIESVEVEPILRKVKKEDKEGKKKIKWWQLWKIVAWN